MQLATHPTGQSNLFPLNVLHQYANSFLKSSIARFWDALPAFGHPPAVATTRTSIRKIQALQMLREPPGALALSDTLTL